MLGSPVQLYDARRDTAVLLLCLLFQAHEKLFFGGRHSKERDRTPVTPSHRISFHLWLKIKVVKSPPIS